MLNAILSICTHKLAVLGLGVIDDLYRFQVNCSTDNRQWSFGGWLTEAINSSDAQEGQIVADALHAKFITPLTAALCTDARVESFQAWKRYNGTGRPGLVIVTGGVGTGGANPMPNNCPLVIGLQQNGAPAKHNGRVFISGQSEDNHQINEWLPAWLTGAAQTLADVWTTRLVAVSPAIGEWDFAILANPFGPPSTPLGSPLPVTAAVPVARVMSQRTRSNSVLGSSV